MVIIKDEHGQPRAHGKIPRHGTEPKLAKEVDRVNDRRLIQSLDAAGVGTWFWEFDPEGSDQQRISLDDCMRQLMGMHTSDETERTLGTFLTAIHKEDRQRVHGELDRCRKACGLLQVDFRIAVRDGAHPNDGGTARWIRLRGRTTIDDRTAQTVVAGVGFDISESKETENQLREADRKKDEFLALLTHELRNPLAPLRNGLQIMRLAPSESSAFHEARAMMDRQLSHMVRLIDDLLDVTRISQNKLHLERARILLADILVQAVETARPAIDAADHSLTIQIPPEPIFINADLMRLSQVFANLLINSAKYTPREGRIALSAVWREGEVAVTVRDSGIGIPAEALPTIFDMFSQVDRNMERTSGGLGIGLALVKGLVEMHGGTVQTESSGLGQGSAFTVTLPARNPEKNAPTLPVADEEQIIKKGRRILVVDDNRDAAQSMAMMLKLLKHEVQTAHDGLEAIEKAKEFGPEVILMDVGMPRLDGLQATRRIREQPGGQDITIIALTGWAQESDRDRSSEAGCDGHLVKPVNPFDLDPLLDELSARDSKQSC